MFSIKTGDTMFEMSTKKLLVAILIVAAVLRFWNLSGIAPSLFGDELDVGYHAYSVLETGKDYSGNFLPLHFQSLAEWRTPLYLYSVVPTVAIWGISPLGVRVPAAIFGLLGVWGMFLLVRHLTKKDNLALLSSLLLAISPWHIQYSRAAFEVTMLIAFILFGLYFFFRSLKEGKFLWLSVSLLVVTPLIYSTAKLFTPLLLVFLLVFYRKEIFKLKRKFLIWAVIAGLFLGGVTSYATLFSGGGQRFGYISVFTDPTIIPEVGDARLRDARVRGEMGSESQPAFIDRATHNKYTFWIDRVTDNYLQAFSTNFLFIEGDPIPRHSMNGVGQFYEIEALALLVGTLLFFAFAKDKRLKYLMGFWVLAAVLPSSVTRGGGNHATRLILMLPPLIFLISYGILEGAKLFKKNLRPLVLVIYFAILASSFFFYSHNYRFHYPWDSEGWWHSGWEESVEAIKERKDDYERVFITMADEPAWIFFAAWSEYPPEKWHEGYPMEDTFVEGFGGMSYIDKYHFGSPDEDGSGIYGLPNYITRDDLYLATAKEVPGNLITDPGRTPNGLELLESITFPSGEPAFYLFTKTE